ncbi:hypothetical protein G7050_02620 [Dysgonomonas sp. HDW5A]|uniref:hypothetical protein n=1 Tax=Dysgonomonas sp. HDW5A TaxID=2714926 RepID=UPI001409AE35|nr:hypothetical protein [Dysgonomonas sp. HDW5A]QIK58793.1 hypothetical protein G7050_02620 [Dysgonomonas sp. HDW5A]
MEAIDRLKQMIGNVYRYEGGIVTVCDVKIVEPFGILKADTGDIKISLDNIDGELSFLSLKKDNEMVRSPTVMQMVYQSGAMYAQLHETLLDNIKMVQENSGYINNVLN